MDSVNDFVGRLRQVESGGNMAAIGPSIPGQGSAKSDMQVMDATNKAPGYGVAPARDDSLEERSRVGREFGAAMLREYGSEDDAAAAYNWGPGNLNKWVKGGRDPAKMPKETRDYIGKVAALRQPGSSPAAPAGPRPLRPLTAMELGIQRTAIRPHNRDMAAELLEDRLARETTEANMPGFSEIAGAAWDKNTDSRIWGSLKERIWGPEYPAEPGFKPDYSKLDNLRGDATLLEDYSAATSPAAADKVLREFNEERARVTTLMSQGLGIGIAASFGSELTSPTNWVMALTTPHLMAAKGVGAVAMAASGASRTSVIAASVAENLITGTALEATAQLLEGRVNGLDLLINMTADGLLGAGAGSLIHRAGAIARTEGLVQRVNETARAQETEAVAKAQAKLGPEATTEQVVAEVKAQRVAEANEPIKQATVADNNLSVSQLTTLEASEALVEGTPTTTVAKTGPTESGLVGGGALNTPPPGVNVAGGSVTVTRTPGLPAELDGAKAVDDLSGYPTVDLPPTAGEYAPPLPTTAGFTNFIAGNTTELARPDGKARVVYHLSNADVEAFDKSKLGTNTGAASSREGFFFAGKVQTTHAYARPEEGSPNVMPVYLSMKNPLVFDMGGKTERTRSYAGLLREARAKGNDGLIVKNTYDGGPLDDIIVVFEPTQVKSAISNTGDYSQTDPRISYDVGDFDSLEKLVTRKADFNTGGKYEAEILERTGGMIKDLKGLEALGAGVHITPAMLAKHGAAFDTLTRLAKRFLKDVTIVLHSGEVVMPDGKRANADISQVTDKIALIRLDPNLEGAQAVRAAVHELGHAIFNRYIAELAPEMKAKLLAAFAAFTEAAKKVDGNEARGMRYSVTNPRLKPELPQSPQVEGKYEINWDELSAEQFGKFIDEDIAGPNRFGLHAKVIQIVKAAIANAVAWLTFAKRADLGVNDAYREFFETLSSDPVVAEARKTLTLKKPAPTPVSQADTPADVVASILRDPDANRFGLGTAPVATKTERDEVKAILNLHKQAEQKAPALTPEYEKRAQNLSDNNLFNVASTGLIMLKSKSPLVRWVAGELLEDASGVQAKRGITASIKKHIMYRAMMDNAINDFDSAYRFWSKDKPGGFQDDMIGGKNRDEFERLVMSEIEARRATRMPVTTEPNVKGAADVIEAAFTRTAKAQVSAGTLGSAGLPADSIGYVTHRVSAGKFMSLPNEQREVVHQALVDQFITIEGWDASFSDMLASKYLQRVQDRATGGNGSNIGGNNAGSIDLVEEALKAAQVPADQIKAHMERFKKGAANYTKGRIELDLNKVYTTANGDFKLLDIFETNPIELLRSQVERASGEVALALKGVQGKPGLDLLRKAMTFGEDGKKASLRELEAFDQVAAELMGEPFGSATPKWMERAMSANTLVRLGGIIYNQISESINGIVHVGAMRTLESITSIPRLRQEILALARGEKVDNPIIGSLEIASGAEFGTDSYKIVMPYDNPSNTMPTYGQDTLTLTDRLLRGGGHLQSKLSFWRAMHSSQQRGMSEQIVHKALRYIREGKDDIALGQFGITPELQAAMRAELATIAKFDGSGRLLEFDVTKMSDPDMREAFIQAVWRGNSQIIQGTFIGERGKWAHDGVLKMMTQFRTFPIVSMEKQWGRQRNSRGAAAAFGIVLGAMSLAWPIYMARTYASSIGRPDQEAYLEERLQLQHVVRATMNYVGGIGMAGDFVDAASALMPDSMSLRPTGGRAAVETDFVGNFIAPAASLADDVWKYLQSPMDLEDATRIMPFRNLPLVLPLMNMAKD